MKAWQGKYYPVYENLSDCYFDGLVAEASYEKGMEIIKTAADSGLKEAQFDLAYKYENEEAKLSKAKEYYEKAALQGFYSALLVLKEWFSLVHGKEANLLEYEKWEKAVREKEELLSKRRRNKIKALIPSLESYAKKENAEAQYNLALIYSRDSINSVKPDLEKYIYWLKKSADNGFKKACYYLGMCYSSGDGVGKNKALATHYLNRVDSNAEVSWQLENIYGARLGITEYLNKFSSCDSKHKSFYIDESAD
nr:sel1 repeat family protein [Treponema sp.]